MVRVIVLDRNDDFIEELSGTYNAGTFAYKRGQHGFWLFKFGGEKEGIEFDYEKCIKEKGGRTAYYRWDGKNLNQLSFGDFKESSITVDYMKNFKLGEYAKASVLKNPSNLEDMIRWIAIIALVILFLGAWYDANLNYTNLQKLQKPFGLLVNETIAQGNFNANQIQKLTILYNETLNYTRSSNVYIQQHP